MRFYLMSYHSGSNGRGPISVVAIHLSMQGSSQYVGLGNQFGSISKHDSMKYRRANLSLCAIFCEFKVCEPFFCHLWVSIFKRRCDTTIKTQGHLPQHSMQLFASEDHGDSIMSVCDNRVFIKNRYWTFPPTPSRPVRDCEIFGPTRKNNVGSVDREGVGE